jgi:amino acid adenylation domain-containing protein
MKMRAVVEYDARRISAADGRRIAAYYGEIFRRMVESPASLHHGAEPVLALEQEEIARWNETEREYPAEQRVEEVFAEQARLHPEAIALVSGREQLSYGELEQRANRLARYLRRQGVQRETLVGVCLERSIEMVVALLGILKAGGAYVPLAAEYPVERLGYMISDSGVKVVVTRGEWRGRLLEAGVELAGLVCVDEDAAAIGAESEAALEASGDDAERGAELAYVMYTSGSTGAPKGVLVPHRGITRLVCNSNYVELGADEVMLQLAPVGFDASTFEIWGALLRGGRLVLMRAGVPSLAEIGAVLRSAGVTVLWLTAPLFRAMAAEQVEALAGVKQVLAGGDVLAAESVRRYLEQSVGGRAINGYGPTEGTTFSCCHVMRELGSEVRNVPIGKAISNSRAYVLDEQQRLVPVGAVGELYIGGAGVARGYLGRAELTAERFVPDPYSGIAGERLYRTGDLVRYVGKGGELEFIGRRDEQVKLRGYRIELGEIEAALRSHEGVQEAVVVAAVGAGGEKRLVAYVVEERAGSAGGASELRSYLSGKLPEYMVPGVYVVLEELPLTANGKVDRRQLAEREVEVDHEREYVGPRTAVEEILCGIWEAVLQVERVGVHDNFFELGGHSLLATQVVSRVRQALAVELPLRALFAAAAAVVCATAVMVHRAAGAGAGSLQRQHGAAADRRVGSGVVAAGGGGVGAAARSAANAVWVGGRRAGAGDRSSGCGVGDSSGGR